MSHDPPVPALPAPAADAVPEAYRAGVAAQWQALQAQAQLVDELQLPDDLEPATVFVP